MLKIQAYLKNLIYAQRNSKKIDGIHLHGPGASRHFTYRVVQAVKTVMATTTSGHSQSQSGRAAGQPISDRYESNRDNNTRGEKYARNFHSDCPQAQFQQQVSKKGKSYSDAVKGKRNYVYRQFQPLIFIFK